MRKRIAGVPAIALVLGAACTGATSSTSEGPALPCDARSVLDIRYGGHGWDQPAVLDRVDHFLDATLGSGRE
jgi:hypothetical protein